MNLETKITIYKFTPQVFTLTPYRGYSRQSAGYTGSYRQYPPSHGPDKPAGTRNKRLNNFPFSLVIPMEFTFKIK